MAWFAKDAWELGPGFRCVLCVRDEKDLPGGCPKCELAQLYNIYREQIESEMARRGWHFTRELSLDKLLHLHQLVADLLNGNRDRVLKKWSVKLITLVNIVISERSQCKYAVSWQQWKDAKGR